MNASHEHDEEGRFWRALRRGERRSEVTAADEPPAEGDPAHADGRPVHADGHPAPSADEAVRPEQDAKPDEPARTSSSHGRGDDAFEARRAALRSMLDAAEARVTRASRARRPVLASGAVVRVTRGELAGCTGVVLDADYIESRVLLSIDPSEPPRWVPFRRVGPAETSD